MADDDINLYLRFTFLLNEKYCEYAYADLFAAELNVTQRKLNESVKRICGKTPCQLVEEKISFEAQKLLMQTTQTVKEIAFTLGYEDQYYFNRLFKKINGYPPGKFRKIFYRFRAPS